MNSDFEEGIAYPIEDLQSDSEENLQELESLVEYKRPINLLDLRRSILPEMLKQPPECPGTNHGPMQLMLETTANHLFFVCPKYGSNCLSACPAHDVSLAYTCDYFQVPYSITPRTLNKHTKQPEIARFRFRPVSLNTETTPTVLGIDFQNPHQLKKLEALLRAWGNAGSKRLDKMEKTLDSRIQERNQQELDRLKQSYEEKIGLLKEEKEKQIKTIKQIYKKRNAEELESLKQAHEQELQRLKHMYEKRNSSSKKRKQEEDDEEEKEEDSNTFHGRKRKKPCNSSSNEHCTPPDEEEFWEFVKSYDASLVKLNSIAKQGYPYRGHYLRCPECKQRWTLSYSPERGYSLSNGTHTTNCSKNM